ncbi:DUF6768 family protein [Glaciecola sp. 1036]|uniref:DUF6768 family protein n=1 Tax=Alteromonadaceae TaxID=72275 RepID=UPI003CFDB7AC
MNSDEKIKQDLQQQAKALDDLMRDQSSLADYLKMGFASNFGWLVKLGYGIAIILSILMFYCGYQFFNASPDNELFWGICLMLSFNAQIATKLWVFMQINRNHLAKEIRYLELRLKS